MIPKETEAEVLRLFHAEKWRIGTIASQLGVHHTTVQRVLRQAGVEMKTVAPRPSMADAYVPFVVQQLEKYPGLRASRLFEMVRDRGYQGGADHFRRIVSRHRPRQPAEAFQRLKTLPGEQGQVDWAHFGKHTVGRAERPLWAFVMVLSFSRQVFLRFFLGAAMPFFIRGHVDAFAFFGGAPRVLLYDNLKSAVLERQGDIIRFNPKLLELAAHYHVEARPVAVARGNEKGRVERAIRYVRDAFFAARKYSDIADLNRQAEEWCRGASSERKWVDDKSRTVRDAFSDEQGRLLPLPNDPFPAVERVEVEVGKTPYARFDLNDYSVPHDRVVRQRIDLGHLVLGAGYHDAHLGGPLIAELPVDERGATGLELGVTNLDATLGQMVCVRQVSAPHGREIALVWTLLRKPSGLTRCIMSVYCFLCRRLGPPKSTLFRRGWVFFVREMSPRRASHGRAFSGFPSRVS